MVTKLQVALALSLSVNFAGLGFAAYTLATRSEVRPSTYARHRTTLFAELPMNESSIVFLGDSLTDWCEWAELLGEPRIVNRGISGDTATGVRARLDAILEARPARIFLMVGANDILAGVAVDEVAVRYRDILAATRRQSPDTEVIIQSVMPMNFGLLDSPPRDREIVALNRVLKRLAQEYSYRFIDLFADFADASGELDERYTYDGVHLNGQGYRRWGNALAAWF